MWYTVIGEVNNQPNYDIYRAKNYMSNSLILELLIFKYIYFQKVFISVNLISDTASFLLMYYSYWWLSLFPE